MKRFSHTFLNFDPLATSLLRFPGLLDANLTPVFLQTEPVDLSEMTWAAAKAVSASASSSEIDGPSQDEFERAVQAGFLKGEEVRRWLIALPAKHRTWTENGVPVQPYFEQREFTYIVDLYTALLVEEFPSNPDWQDELEACVAPLALAVLVLVDEALTSVHNKNRDFANIALVTAIAMSARSRQIPKMLSRSPQTLSKFGGLAKNKVNRHMAQFARERYEIRNVEEKFANRKVAAQAIRVEVEAEALRHKMIYSAETFGETLYKWLLAK